MCKRLNALLAASLILGSLAWGSTERVLYTFMNGSDGGIPINSGQLTFDHDGNLYGTTELGGDCGNGTVFKLTPGTHRWTETVLHSFCGDEGIFPYAGVIFDGAGNLYGTTTNGGAFTGGTVFQLSPSGSDWTLTTLYNFAVGTDGGGPYGGVIMDRAGNLYGTAVAGGVNACRGEGCGIVFKLTKSGSSWNYSVIHSFISDDGAYPYAGLVMGGDGNLYGTTQSGGLNGMGVVFQLQKSPGGAWVANVLHSFGDAGDGQFPGYAKLTVFKGAIYGTVPSGGANGQGLVFSVSRAGGSWKETILYNFTGGEAGSVPYSGVKFDQAGNIWGTTEHGGGTECQAPNGCGTIFKLAPKRGGGWVENDVVKFVGPNGAIPLGSVISDGHGHLYGSTSQGGTNDTGIVFALKP